MKIVNGYTGKVGEHRRVLMQQYRAHHAHVKPQGQTVKVENGFTTKWEDGVYRTPEGYECCSWCGKWHMGKADEQLSYDETAPSRYDDAQEKWRDGDDNFTRY